MLHWIPVTLGLATILFFLWLEFRLLKRSVDAVWTILIFVISALLVIYYGMLAGYLFAKGGGL